MNFANAIDFNSLMERVAARLAGEPNKRLSNPPRDVRFGTHGSLSIDYEAGQFYDHEANVGGGVCDLVKHKIGCDHAGAVAWLRQQGILPSEPRPKAEKPIATYDYAEAFGKSAKNAEIALFYFSGHGLQLGGDNYLVPTGFESGKSPIVHALSAAVLMKELAASQAKVKIVLLDACRTPFMKGGGLAPMQDFAVNGTVISFATQPNRTAWTGPPDGNSPYAKALATKLSVKGLQLYDLLIDVGLEVMSVTHNAQEPSVTTTPLRVVLNQNPIATSPDTKPPSPTVQTSLPNGQALRFVQSAHKMLDNKDFSGARDELTRGIQSDPGLGLTYNYRGYAWYEEGLSKSPSDALRFYNKAFSDLDEAIRLSPTYAPAYRHRGNTILASFKALKTLGRPTNNTLDNAVKDFKTAMQLDSASKTSPNSLGGAYLLKGDYASAIKSFNAAIAINPTYAAPYAGLCATYKLMGNATLADDYKKLASARDDDSSKACLAQQH